MEQLGNVRIGNVRMSWRRHSLATGVFLCEREVPGACDRALLCVTPCDARVSCKGANFVGVSYQPSLMDDGVGRKSARRRVKNKVDHAIGH